MASRHPPTTDSDRFESGALAAKRVSDGPAPGHAGSSRANLLRLCAVLTFAAWFAIGSALLLKRVLPDRDGWPRPALFLGAVGGFFLLLYTAATHDRLEAWLAQGRYASTSRRVAGVAAAILVTGLLLAWGVQLVWQSLDIITAHGR